MKYDISILKQIIISAARDELLPRFADVQRNTRMDGSFVTEVDLAVQASITHALQEHYPDTKKPGQRGMALT